MDDSFREQRCGICGVVFYLCRVDDYGQVYCPDCQELGRTRSARAAQARYRAHPLVRADHRDYMREWRAGKREKRTRVRDQGPKKLAPSGKVWPDEVPQAAMDTAVAPGPRCAR